VRYCKNRVTVSRENAEFRYFELLVMHVRSARLLAKLPSLAAQTWAERKQTIADDARVLSRRLNEQETLRRRLIKSKLTGEIDADDYKMMRESIDAEIRKIKEEEKALDSEASTMQELIKQQDEEPLDFRRVWQRASFHHKIEMQKVFYPEGLVYSAERGYFDTANRRLFLQLESLFADELNIGAPDGI
jgi:hypothetical protein